MFCIDDNYRYWFNGLNVTVTDRREMTLQDGDVFVFVNASRTRMKILYRKEGGFVLFSIRIEIGRMRILFTGESDEIAWALGYESLISTAKSAMESPYVMRINYCRKTLDRD